MAKITIDQQNCKSCLLCIDVCPRGLIKLGEKLNRRGVKPVRFEVLRKAGKKDAGVEPVSNKECLGCLQCALICPDCCIEVYK